MAPDRVYPDGEAPFVPAGPPPPGAYYNVKDQQIPPPATYQERRRRRSPCCCCLIWLCAIHFILLFLIGLAVLIFWLVVMPKAPEFHVQTVHISGITETSISNATIDYKIMARNPNKKISFYYSDISVKVEESGNTIGQESISDFSQGHKNTTYVNGEIDNLTISSSTLASIKQTESNVPLYAQVDFKVKAKVGSLKFSNIKIKVKCNVNVDLTVTNGSQLKSSKCKVHW